MKAEKKKKKHTRSKEAADRLQKHRGGGKLIEEMQCRCGGKSRLVSRTRKQGEKCKSTHTMKLT